MEFLGVKVRMKNVPELDPGFIPLHAFNIAFLAGAKKPIGIAVERAKGEMASCHTFPSAASANPPWPLLCRK